MTALHIDLETRSTVDLRKTGVYVYADDPSTEILMAAWAIDDEPVRIWYSRTEAIPDSLWEALTDPTAPVAAHSAQFERIMLRKRFPSLQTIERWDCTAARAAAMGLPRTLEVAAKALDLSYQKDAEGHDLMMRMCKPRRPRKGEDPDGIYWFDDDERMARLAAYCARDVEVERALDKVLPKLSAIERQVWETTEAMNDTGITVDADLLERVSALVADAATHLDANIRTATGGAVPRITDHAALTRWLVAQGVEQAAETGIGKQMVLDMLESVELDPLVRQVLMYRRDGGGSSAKKYRAIAKRLSADDRLRGALVYAGAAATGRWSSRGAQLQNLPRGGTVKTDDAIRDLFSGADINYIEDVYGPPLIVASELLRPVFTASPDHWLARGDYSQIEARVLAWLAGQENVLDAFLAYDRGTGPDLYKITASGIYGKPVEEITKAERQIGKVAMLALGYQGGKGAFLAMAKGYGVKVSEEKAEEIKLAWRAANPCIAGSGFDGSQVGLWKQLEWAALACVKDPPNIFHPVGDFGIGFRRNKKAMAMRLPSGRWLVYWWPKLEEVEVTWSDKKKLAVTYWAEDPIKKTWAKFTAYGGLWTENLVQAAARDLMAYALVRFTLVGIRPILTVHDEGIGEAPKTRFPRAEDAAAAVKQVMEHIPAWAAGLPVSADASAAERYVKA